MIFMYSSYGNYSVDTILRCVFGEYSSQKNRESRREARNCEGTE